MQRARSAPAFAASAEAQLTGKLAVCAGSCGPGNLHLINGLFDANRSRVPVLALVGGADPQDPVTNLGDLKQDSQPLFNIRSTRQRLQEQLASLVLRMCPLPDLRIGGILQPSIRVGDGLAVQHIRSVMNGGWGIGCHATA